MTGLDPPRFRQIVWICRLTHPEGDPIHRLGRSPTGAQLKTPKKRAGTKVSALVGRIWRLPTLAEAIQPLPSAMLRLTAVFGMGTGRTTALWPPKNDKEQPGKVPGSSLKTTHGLFEQGSNSRVEIAFPAKGKSDQAARPISISPLNGLLRLHA